MIELINYFLKLIFQYLPVSLLILCVLTIIYGVFLRIFRIQINNPVIKVIIDFFGLHFLDTSQISLEFHNHLKLITDHSKKVIISIKTNETDYDIVDSGTNKSMYQNINWTVFNDVIVLNVSRSFMFTEDWVTLVKLLKCYRTSQPVNGVLFGIYMQEEIDGKSIAKKINLISNSNNFPLYLIITDIKTIVDVDSILEDPTIVGWSAPEIPLKSIYSPTEFIQLKNIIIDHISERIRHLIPTGASPTLALSPFTLATSLDNRLNLIPTLFYNDFSFFLRGVYLTNLADGDRKYVDPLIFDLVFKENLITNNNSPKTRYLEIAHYLFLIIILSVFCILPIIYKDITVQVNSLKMALERLKQIKLSRDNNLTINLDRLKRCLELIGKNRLSFPSIPASWGSNLYRKIESFFIESYYSLIIKEVINQSNIILDDTLKNIYPYTKLPFQFLNFIDIPELQDLYYFIKHILFLKELKKNLFYMSKTMDLFDLDRVVFLLTKNNMSKEYFSYPELYNKARRRLLPEIRNIDDNMITISQILENKINIFLTASHKSSGILQTFEKISSNLENLRTNPDSYNGNDLFDLSQLLTLLSNNIGANAWLTQREVTISDQFSDIFIILGQAFGDIVAEDIKKRFNLGFAKIKSELLNFTVPIYGNLIVTEGDKIRLSNQAQELIDLTNALDAIRLRLNSNLTRNLHLAQIDHRTKYLDPLKIKSISNNIEKMNDLLKHKTNTLPIEIRLTLIGVIKKMLTEKIINDLNEIYQNNSGQNSGDYGLSNLLEVLPDLINIIRNLKVNNSTVAYELKNSINSKYDYILTRTYNDLESKNIYSINSMALLNPVTNEEIINNFIASNRNQLEKYFNKIKLIIDNMSIFYRENDEITKLKISESWDSIIRYFIPNTDISLEVLENYIKKSLRAKDSQELALVLQNSPKTQSTDFVGKKIDEINQILKNKINLTITDELSTLFHDVKDAFDSNLFGYFPFADINAPDVPKSKFANFYQFWIKNQDKIKNFLNLIQDKDSLKNKEWYSFLRQLYSYMQFLENLVYSSNLTTIKIRDTTNQEKNLSNLTIWRILIKSDPKTNYIEKNVDSEPVNLICNMNESINLTLNNLSSIDMVKKMADTISFVFVDTGKKVTGISEDGPFCFSRFIERYYNYQDKDTIFLKIVNPVIDKNSNSKDELIGWISITCPNILYIKAPTKAPVFTGL